jgi:hypothetical protein
MKGKKIKITDPKLTRIYNKEFYLLFNINNKLWALGITPTDSIAFCYAGESQFKLI